MKNDNITGTFEIRINNNSDKSYLFSYIKSYRHWQNILTILTVNLFKEDNPDYKYFLDSSVIRACITGTSGGKAKDKVEYIKNKYQDNDLYNSLISVGQDLKTHNLVMIIRRFKKDFSNYFKCLKDWKKNPDKYTGCPKLPRAKKISGLTNFAIPLDQVSWSSKKNLVGINLNQKMRYFYIGKIIKNCRILGRTIKSIAVKMKNKEIYLSFSCSDENEVIANSSTKKAGIDIGLNNLATIFIDDQNSQSLIVDGSRYKFYNSKFNRLVSKLNESIASEVIETRVITKKDNTTVEIPVKWTKRGHRLKRFVTFLYFKRDNFFKTEFHQQSKRIVEYLLACGVKQLVLSRSLSSLMNNGECNLRKATKQNFIQVPFIQLIDNIEEKALKNGIKVVFIDEAYTSKTSCISGDVTEIQKKAKSKSISTNEFKGTRVKRGLFKDSIIDKIWNADLNGAVNHIKVAFKDNFDWLRTALFKLCNPVVIKSANDFLMFLIGNSNAGKVQLSNAGQTS